MGPKKREKELKPIKTVDVQASNYEVHDYVEERINDNDTYKTFGVWIDQFFLLGMNIDEMIDNKKIIIKYDAEKGYFIIK
jgi:hypothetical protein